jgi:prolyl oligopeptidase
MKTSHTVAAALVLAACNLAQAQSVDPYQWMEEVQGEKALNWVKQQNQITRDKLKSDTAFDKLRTDVQAVLDSKDRIPGITKMGDSVYNFWMDAQNPRGVWRKTSFAEYKKAQPKWEVVLDVDALAKAENENWVYKGSSCRGPVYDRCLIQLSRGGADAVSIREFDLKTKSFVKDGFQLPEAKSTVTWRDKDHLFVATDFGAGSMTDSGYARIVKEWKRGTTLSSAKVIYEGKSDDMMIYAYRAEHGGQAHDLVRRTITFYSGEYFLRENDQWKKLDLPSHGDVNFFGSQIIVNPKQEWKTKDATYPAGSLLAMDFKKYMAGERKFTVLFQPSDSTSLTGEAATKNYLLVQSLEHVKSSLVEWSFKKQKWTSRKVDLPTMGAVGVAPIDSDKNDEYLLSYSDYLTPSVLLHATAGKGGTQLLKSAPSFFDARAYVTKQKFAVSKDGTQVPYFIVHHKDMKFDGSNPTLLYGYGGFEVSLTPSYSGALGLTWLDRGGVYVVANIRGGGEYGPRWHQAALKENRQRAYDDFAAVAEDLIHKKITTPRHLGAMGGSNGGLLAGVALTQRPELFNAVVSQVPLLDMQRYNKLLAGASWMGEYGNPDVPEEWAYIQKYSPYHNVSAEKKYPNVLFITSTRDDRVHPGHARKMAAKMMDMGANKVLYYENMEGGHGGAANNAQRADMNMIAYSFLWNSLK